MLKSVAVIGSCQIGGVGWALKNCSPGLNVRLLNPRNTKISETELVVEALAADAIVTQDLGPPALHLANLSKLHSNVHFFPMLVFRGFHPDCVSYLDGARLFPGVIGQLHSVIVSSCYALGVPESQTAALFNALVYRALGYFDVFSSASAQTINQFAKVGYDISSNFQRWASLGQFMYTSNHPRIEVLLELGELLSLKLGTHARDLSRQPVSDNLRNLGFWPTYPELAKSLQINGSLTFRSPGASGQFQETSLATFIADSYRLYSERGRPKMLKIVAGPRFDVVRRLLNQ